MQEMFKQANTNLFYFDHLSPNSPPMDPFIPSFTYLLMFSHPTDGWVTASGPGQWSILCFVLPWMKFSLPSVPALIYYQPPPFSGGSADLPASCTCIFYAVLSSVWEGIWLTIPLISFSLSLSCSHSSHFSSPLSLPGGPADLTAEGEGRLVQWAAAQLRAAASWVARARRRDWQAGEPHSRAGAGLAGQRWVPGEG